MGTAPVLVRVGMIIVHIRRRFGIAVVQIIFLVFIVNDCFFFLGTVYRSNQEKPELNQCEQVLVVGAVERKKGHGGGRCGFEETEINNEKLVREAACTLEIDTSYY